MKIAVVSPYYSRGMGYSENCLSKALAKLGHEVHVVTSKYNVYGNEPLYDDTYLAFLGPRAMPLGSEVIDGYTVHRLDARLVSGYVDIKGLTSKIRELAPDIVHSFEVASLPTFELAALKPFAAFKLFTETHHTMSVMRPYMRNPSGKWMKRAVYRLTRTLPSFLATLSVERCYAVTPDCGEVARRFFGVPASKIAFLSLGADTEMFHPIGTDEERESRQKLRDALGFSEDDIICVYTGRFSNDKNPCLVAKAIDSLADTDPRYKGVFIGDGVQKAEIAAHRNVVILPFMTHAKLAEHYRAADIGVWPKQESMSMIDAAASGIPIVVSNRIGEPKRAEGNGKMYVENDVASLADVLRSFSSGVERRTYGDAGRRKMLDGRNWEFFARTLVADFAAALAGDR